MAGLLEKLQQSFFSKVGEKLAECGWEVVTGNKDTNSSFTTLQGSLKSLSNKACDIKDQIKHGEQSGKMKRKREDENRLEEVHSGGSITHLTHMDRLKDKYGCDPTVLELFLETYSHLNSKGEREWSDARSAARHGTYVETHEHLGDDAASSEAPPPLQIQIERRAAMDGEKKKGRIYGLSSLSNQFLGSSSSPRGPTQREQQLETELSKVRAELSQVKDRVTEQDVELQQMREQMTAIDHMKAKLETFDQMAARIAAFEKIQAQMKAFMMTAQPNQGLSLSFHSHSAGLPIPPTVAPMRSGKFTTPNPPWPLSCPTRG